MASQRGGCKHRKAEPRCAVAQINRCCNPSLQERRNLQLSASAVPQPYKAEPPRVAAMQNVMHRRAVLMRRHLATQQQGDWTAVAARDYASHRQTFQADYARDCWRRLSSRPAVAPVVARATRVLDVGCGSGEFTRELAELLAHRTIVGLDVSSDMVAHARAANAHERVSYIVADLASSADRSLAETAEVDVLDVWARDPPMPQWHGESFQVATSTMALHWPGPDPSFLSGVRRLLDPGGVFLAGLHGAGSCQEGVDAFERVAGLDLEGLPTMFKRRSAAAWEKALCDAGFVDVAVDERTVATRYASAADCQRRLAAAWPPILSGHVPDGDVDALVAAAAQVMIDGSGLMTSRLLEFSACVPSVIK